MSTVEKLWAVHVLGPDDILAMPDRETAETVAAQINGVAQDFASRPSASDLDPHVSAEVVEWPWDFQAHGEAVTDADGEYLP